MKRTIKDIYELLIEKRNYAYNDYTREYESMKETKVTTKCAELNGEIRAYTDIICLIESSEVLDSEKILNTD